MRNRIRVAVLAVAISVGFGAAPVIASQLSEIEYTYYSDATHSTQVGYRVRACNGGWYSDGVRTEFFVVTTTPC